MFRPISAEFDFVALEEAELARWSQHDIFARSMQQREGAPAWVFYEGPPPWHREIGFSVTAT